MSISAYIKRTFTFDDDKQQMYLTIVAAQASNGRPYADIFKSLRNSHNKVFRELAARSLNPNSEYFASQYADYFGPMKARLLILGQKFNVVTEIIDELINKRDKKELSFVSKFVSPNILEILLSIAITGIFVAIYLLKDFLLENQVDISTSLAYSAGEFIVHNYIMVLTAVGALLFGYFFNRTRHTQTRTWLKANFNLFNIYDAIFTADMFRMIHIITSKPNAKGVGIRSLAAELSIVYGRNPLRKYQFQKLQISISEGKTFYESLRESKLLTNESLDLFRGLAPNESIQEICRASKAVAHTLNETTKLEIKYKSKLLTLVLYAYLAFTLIAVMILTMGSGLNIMSNV